MNDSEMIYNVFLLLGGIGLFLYGINFLSSALKELVGDKMRDILERATGKSWFAVLTGIIVTLLIQSSGATSVMVVGFVSAGMMELSQAISVMLGANIGTTITAQIIAFKIDKIAPLILFIGLILYMFIKNKTVKKTGAVVLAFGTLFVGIYIMGMAVKLLPLGELVAAFLDRFSNPVLCILFGVLITAIIQSSSASIGILQVLVVASSASIGLDKLVFIILGMNIGAASPVVIASFAGNKSAKRTAFANVITKVIGVLAAAILMLIIPSYISLFEKLSPGDVSRQIANFHLAFNLISLIVTFPLVKLIEKMTYKILPNTAEENMNVQKLLYISPESLLSPTIAVTQAKREIERMAKMTKINLENSLNGFFSLDANGVDSIYETEKTINFLNHEITAFLVKLHGKSLPEHDLETVGMMFRVVSDIERLGDHAENIAEYTTLAVNERAKFSEDALEELKTIAGKTVSCVNLAFETYFGGKHNLLSEVSLIEEEVDDLQESLVENHIKRLKDNKCDPRGGIIFTDLTTDLERCSDHAINIAYAIKGEKTTVQMKKAYVIARGSDVD